MQRYLNSLRISLIVELLGVVLVGVFMAIFGGMFVAAAHGAVDRDSIVFALMLFGFILLPSVVLVVVCLREIKRYPSRGGIVFNVVNAGFLLAIGVFSLMAMVGIVPIILAVFQVYFLVKLKAA